MSYRDCGTSIPACAAEVLNQIRTLFVVTLTELSKILPVSTNIARAVENGNEDNRMFVRGLYVCYHVPLESSYDMRARNVLLNQTQRRDVACDAVHCSNFSRRGQGDF